MNVPTEFIEDYKASRHYEPGDEVIDIEAGIDGYNCSYITLYILRDGVEYALPFYYNQAPYEPGYEYNGNYPSEADDIEENVEGWLEGMAGATEWYEWYNDINLQEVW